jgi:hypothetical protein
MDIGCNMDTFPDNSNMDTLLEDMSTVDMNTLWDISIELDTLFGDWPD